MLDFMALTEEQVVHNRERVAFNRLQQLEAEYISVGEAIEQFMMGDPTEAHTAEQLKTLQKSKETIELMHSKYKVRYEKLKKKVEEITPQSTGEEASGNLHSLPSPNNDKAAS